MMLVSAHSSTGRGTGTGVFKRAFNTRYSRATSCAVGNSGPRGGRRKTHSWSPRVMKNVSLECPPRMRSTITGRSALSGKVWSRYAESAAASTNGALDAAVLLELSSCMWLLSFPYTYRLGLAVILAGQPDCQKVVHTDTASI